MARIVYPDDFMNQQLLLQKVMERYDSMPPAANPLTVFLTQQAIVLTDDAAAAMAALAHEHDRRDKAGQAEYHTRQRDLAFGPVFAHMRGIYKYLKGLYGPAFMELALWGAPVLTSGRIAYPNAFSARVSIFNALMAKYGSTPPASSPLAPFLALHGLSMADLANATALATQHHNLAKALAGQAEDATQDRNNAWNPVMAHLRAIGGFLKNLHSTNPKELNLWGYTVDHSPRAPRQVKSKVKLLSHITVNSLIIGGTFRNIGTVPLIVYKGSAATGPSVTVNPGELYGIAKGYSILTVANPSSTTTGEFSALRAR